MCALLDITKTTYKCLNYFLNVHSFSLRNVCYLNKSVNSRSNLLQFFKTSEIELRLSHQNATEKANDANKDGNAKPQKKKKEKLTYITLVELNKNITVTTLEDASKLALRRDLKLIKVKEYEAKFDRPTYQLMTTAQYLQEEKNTKNKQENKSIKGTKLLSLTSKINDNDINSKVNNIIKWLAKRNEVRVVISNDNGEADNVYGKLLIGVNSAGKFVQKREKGSEIRFQIVPPKDDKSTNIIEETSNPNTSENKPLS